MRYIFPFLTVIFCIAFAHSVQANQEGIAIVVNEDVITFGELNDRYVLTLVSSRLPDSQETRMRLIPQILGGLVEEQLKFQEATREEIEITDQEVEQGFAQIATQNKIPPEKFKEVLTQSGVNVATMERQVKSQLLWSKVVGKKLRPKVNVSENDIDNTLNRIKNNIGKTEFLTSEIFLPIETPSQEAQIIDLANNLVEQIRTKQAPFFRVAQQFSRAPGAPQGGDLGWIQDGQLSSELTYALQNLQVGQVSNPIRAIGGVHILALRDKRIVSDDTTPSREQIKYDLTLQQIDRLQQRLLMDLKSAAFIESRLGS